MPKAAQSVTEQFWAGVPEGRTIDECWDWCGYRDKAEYGRLTFRQQPYLAHRVSMMVSGQPLKAADLVCHKCDNPSCVNPYHLYLGTHKDNMEDAIARGLAVMPPRNDNRGEKHGMSKLTWMEVRKMRALYEEQDISQAALGRMFGISSGMANLILRNKKWVE